MHYKYLSSLLFKYQAALTRIWSTCANISHKTPPFQAGGVVWWELELWLELKVWWEVEVGWETELWWEMVVWQEMHLTQVWLLQSRWQSCDSSQDTLSVPLLSTAQWKLLALAASAVTFLSTFAGGQLSRQGSKFITPFGHFSIYVSVC